MKTSRTTINNKEAKNEQQQKMEETILWTVEATANQLMVSIKTVKRLIEEDVLPVVPVRGCIRVPKQSVLDWVESQTRYNWRCVGLAVRHPKGERKCLNSAKRRKVSTGVKEVGTGGHLTQRQAVGEFNALLGQPPRGKR
jgi:excisionase family DNA binding protein